jgi:cation transport ATPase
VTAWLGPLGLGLAASFERSHPPPWLIALIAGAGTASLASLLQVDLDDFQRGRPLSVLARYDESAKDESFQRIASRDIQERADELMSAGLERREARQVAEGEFGALALSGLWADPGAFLRTTPVFMWRFSWPMKFSSVVPKALLGAVNMVGMALLLSAAALAVLRRRAVMFAVVGLPAGAAMFYALVTHALARYAQPLAPTMILLIVMAVASILDRRTSSLRLDRRTE